VGVKVLGVLKSVLDALSCEEERTGLLQQALPQLKKTLLTSALPRDRLRAVSTLGMLAQAHSSVPPMIAGNTAVVQHLVALLQGEEDQACEEGEPGAAVSWELVGAAASAVASLCTKKESLERLMAERALQALMTAFAKAGKADKGERTERVQVAAAVGLSKMAALSEEVRDMLVEQGGVDMFLQLADVKQVCPRQPGREGGGEGGREGGGEGGGVAESMSNPTRPEPQAPKH
jgi:hypothetical protein